MDFVHWLRSHFTGLLLALDNGHLHPQSLWRTVLNPSYDQLKQTYLIGEGVTAEADRRQKIAIGLIVSGVVGLGSVFAFRDSAPNWLKSGLYMGAIGCPLVGAYSIRRDKTLTTMGEQFDKASRQHLAADLNMAHETVMKAKESQGWIKAIEIASNLPESMQIGALRRWNLLDLVASENQIIEAEVQEILPEGLEIPPGLMSQATLEQTISDRASEELAIDWFGQWAKRCGAIVGETKDGKSFLLTNIVLAGFIRDHGERGSVWICDPDYGSSHDDSPPNTWLDLEVGRHVFIESNDCFNVLLKISKLVDDRAGATAKALSKKEQKPQFDPALFIMDEVPALMGMWTEAEQKEAVRAIANILRRGLKQKVTFKIGTQTLAVGSLCIPKNILQQLEIVLLWRAAQMADNYVNIGLQTGKAGAIVDQVSLYPQKTGDRYVCVRFADKKLQISGIPIVAPVVVNGVATADRPADNPVEEERSEGDVFALLKIFITENPGADIALVTEFTRLTGRGLSGEHLAELKHILGNMP
jgi:hypothetical protein